MLELAILGLLKEQDLHGYEIKRQLTESLGIASSVSFGSLYPALGRLEKMGAISVGPAGAELAAAPSNADQATPSLTRQRKSSMLTSRKRKVYSITAAGHEVFERLLSDWENDDDRCFNLRLSFARYLPPTSRLSLLEERKVLLVRRLTQLRARGRERSLMDRYRRSLAERELGTIEHDVAWIEQLIAQERAGDTEFASEILDEASSSPSDTKKVTASSWASPLASASQLHRRHLVHEHLVHETPSANKSERHSSHRDPHIHPSGPISSQS